MSFQSAARWVRIRAKILLLAYRVKRHTRLVRAFHAKLEEHMAKFPQQAHDAQREFFLAQLRQMQEQETVIQTAFKTAAKALGVTQ